jgi:hypothetical protein
VQAKWTLIGLLAGLVLGTGPSVAGADGGTVRYSGQHADRLVTVFTDPTPMRTGLVDVSVLVQDTNSGQALADVPIIISAEPIDHSQQPITVVATAEAATNKLLRAARFDLASPGRWHLEVDVEGYGQKLPIEFDVEVAEGLPPWVEMSLWIGWPLAAISLFGVHQLLVHGRAARLSRRLLPGAAVGAFPKPSKNLPILVPGALDSFVMTPRTDRNTSDSISRTQS